jgi:hypothetical protein
VEPGALPSEVLALLGPDAEERTGEGGSLVLAGGGLVAKVGLPALLAREAWALGQPGLPLEAPEIVASGEGWLVTREVADAESAWSDGDLFGALGDLARLHDAFEDALPAEATSLLRSPFSDAGVEELIGRGRGAGHTLPGLLRCLLADPGPILAVVRSQPVTFLHGDPWPGNIRRPAPGRRVWLDWEHASAGPAAADLATWLDETPWHLQRQIDPAAHLEAYLAARRRPVEPGTFGRAVDAAAVMWFFAFDLPRLETEGGTELAQAIIAARVASAERALG